jgi:hypothetical protein
MRAILIGGIGVAAALVAFGISRISDGLVGGASFVLAVFIANFTFGLVVATAIIPWLEKPREPAVRVDRHGSTRRWWLPATASGRCSSCRRRMTQIGFIWVCPECDHVAG